MADYPRAQWFDPPRQCRVCGKPAGALMDTRNSVLAYMCKSHAEREIKASHRKGQWHPDVEIEFSEVKRKAQESTDA